MHWRLGLSTGILVANPIPEADALPEDEVEGWIADGLRAAATEGISGRDMTPFLLDRVSALSQGRSLAANMALIRNNARLAAELATALAAPQ
jgi:pseudouridine-5'-phosphate glycosidase